jgi:hypothetical protein
MHVAGTRTKAYCSSEFLYPWHHCFLWQVRTGLDYFQPARHSRNAADTRPGCLSQRSSYTGPALEMAASGKAKKGQ